MRATNLLVTGAALGAACLLIAPRESKGFSTIGGSLGLTQRDVRVFDNFTMASANNNVTPDVNWPGYTGAEMAIWKACGEWASGPHGGTGVGDPTQPVLGSGGANFDISWQGNAVAVGSINDNVHSMISGCSGGTLAFTQTPISDGWTIRYYECWTWQDGPGSVGGGIDLQGVACHEYGHALGLGHSAVGGTTMFASISGTGTVARSIEADDIAGVKFVYGVKSATKPTITSVSQASGNVTITGVNFSPTNNEVWFTQAATGGNGTPIKVTGVNSNGSVITVAIPATAGKGDVLVRNNGTGHANLSDAWPIDPNAGPSCGVVTYCTAKFSSTGFPAQISHAGTPSFAGQNFFLNSFNGGVPTVPGVYIYSNNGPAATPFINAFLCVAPPIVRGPGHVYDAFGTVTVPISIDISQIGSHRWFQFWFRDTGHPDGTGAGLTDALDVTFCP
jgi:hypothetical protein